VGLSPDKSVTVCLLASELTSIKYGAGQHRKLLHDFQFCSYLSDIWEPEWLSIVFDYRLDDRASIPAKTKYFPSSLYI
jgi:hypothetical protein